MGRPEAPPIVFPARMRDPDPVSRAPWAPPAADSSGNVGKQHGIQGRLRWAPGDNKEKVLIDELRADALWRISIFGNIEGVLDSVTPISDQLILRINYGTSSRVELDEIRTPAIFTLPGQCSISVRPSQDHEETLVVRCNVTPATSGGGVSQLRKKMDQGGIAIDFDPMAVRYVALTASTLTISGTLTAVPALSTVPIVFPSSLTSGAGFQEFEL